MKTTIYIEKKEDLDRNSMLLDMPDALTKQKIYEDVFTIEGEDVAFIAIDVESSDLTSVKEACAGFNNKGIRAMYSGVLDATRIDGVVRKGVCYGYKGENDVGFMIETEVVDLRCQVSFPLVTKRREGKSIKFIPLKCALPTDMATLERWMKSTYALEGKFSENEKSDYQNNILRNLAIATDIYPDQLIWKQSRVPSSVERYIDQMVARGHLTRDLKPAYYVMTDEEIDYLSLDLYVSDAKSMGQNTKRMEFVMPPYEMSSNISCTDQENLIEKIVNTHSAEDLTRLMPELQRASSSIVGENGTVKVENTPNGIKITFLKERNPR